MLLTELEISHFKNVVRGVKFWPVFRWVLLAILGYTALARFSGWTPLGRADWLAAGGVYLLVAWPGLCRTCVFHPLHRLVVDPQARAQLAAVGV